MGDSTSQRLPASRGPLSDAVVQALAGSPGDAQAAQALREVAGADREARAPEAAGPAYLDEDAMVALYAAYELHYRGFAGVDDAWEWHPDLIALVAGLERRLEADLRALAGPTDAVPTDPHGVIGWLQDAVEADDGPSLAQHVQKKADLDQVREYLLHRSVVQLKEADPQTWLLPRLAGQAKGTAVQVQADEYGGGDLADMHSRLWAAAMRGAGLDDTEGCAVDRVPAISLAILNAQTMFGLHRRLRGAGAGFFTIVEMTSSVPMRRYGRGMARVGLGEDVQRYFVEHVEADALHEQLMLRELVAPMVAAEPSQAAEVAFGAQVCLRLDAILGRHLIEAWEAGRSSLRSGGAAAPGEPTTAEGHGADAAAATASAESAEARA